MPKRTVMRRFDRDFLRKLTFSGASPSKNAGWGRGMHFARWRRMTCSSKVIIGLVSSSLTALAAGCSKDGLTTEKTACSYGGKT